MKKIIALAVSAIIVIAVAGAGTYAFFSDTAKSSANQIQAGTLYLPPGASAFFATSADYNNIIPGATHDEYIQLAPGGSVTTDNYLSIQMKNLVLDKSGFNTLVGSTQIHKLDGMAYVLGDAGDLGLHTKVIYWLSASGSANQLPVSGDILLKPGLDGGSQVPFSGTSVNLASWTTIWGSLPTANYTYTGYLNQTASPVTSPSALAFSWNNVLSGAMGTGAPGIRYFHVTFNFANASDNSDNAFQGEKITNDFYFTLATSTAPY